MNQRKGENDRRKYFVTNLNQRRFTKYENVPNMSLNIFFFELSQEFLGTQNRVRISRGKGAIDVRAIEVLLYRGYPGMAKT